ncbi:MAG: hypothetical protein AAFV69_04230 [Pseudomonadota bacterium]
MGTKPTSKVLVTALHASLVALLSSLMTVVAAAAPIGDAPKQVPLTEQAVQSVIAAQPDIKAFAKTLKSPGAELNEEQEKAINEIAKKHGFASFDDLEDATTTISMVLASIDPKTGEFVEPKKILQQELQDIKADKDLADEERKILIEELEAAIASDPNVEHVENIKLVQKFKDDLDKALE